MKSGDQEPLRVLALMEAASVTGPAKNLFEFARRARQPSPSFPAGVDVRIVTFLRRSQSTAFIEGARAAGIPCDVIEEQRAFQLSIGADLRKIVSKYQPDIIQTHNIKSSFLVRLLGLHKQRPWIAFHHGYTSTDFKVQLYNQLNRWSLRAAHRMVAVCGPFADQLARTGLKRERMTVRHNMIRPFLPPSRAEVQKLRERLQIGPAEQVILSAGRLSREKGHLDLLDAIGFLRDTPGLDSFRVIVAGDGPDRKLIEERRAELRLNRIVELAGHQSDLRPWYALADMVVLPSHSEGSPNVLLEALAAGVPVVATAVGGVPEIVTDNVSALLAPKGDSRKMAALLALLLSDRDLQKRLIAEGLKTIEHFSPEAYCEAMLELYREVRESRAPFRSPIASPLAER